MRQRAADMWDPSQYGRFRAERMQPFFDLLAFIRPRPGMRVIDLGCGQGELTALLAERLPDARVEGVDASPAMLEAAARYASERVRFRLQDLREIGDFGAYDLVFSNAVLQWVPDNAGLLTRILGRLRPGAQIAVQVPKNEDHPSHRIAGEVARAEPFRTLLGGFVRTSEALRLEEYATLLWEHGLREQVCIEKVYGHELAHAAEVVEWVKGTSLAAYLARLQGADREAFLEVYRARLREAIGDRAPYFYPFRRLLFWGEKAGG
jgi:trans-aconitate 2-methyltransferase